MSSSLIFGNFTVLDAETTVSNGRTTHVSYRSCIYTEEREAEPIPAVIRAYLPQGATAFDDDTVTFVYGKICGSTRGPFMIEAINMFAYPGDPGEPDYPAVPWFTPRVIVLGHVAGAVEETYEGGRKFKINSTAYVRDKIQATSFMGYFATGIRWKKMPSPSMNSAIQVTGPIRGLDEDTFLPTVTVEDVTLNAGSRSGNVSAVDGSGHGGPRGSASGNARRFAVKGWPETSVAKKSKNMVQVTSENTQDTETDIDSSENENVPHAEEGKVERRMESFKKWQKVARPNSPGDMDDGEITEVPRNKRSKKATRKGKIMNRKTRSAVPTSDVDDAALEASMVCGSKEISSMEDVNVNDKSTAAIRNRYVMIGGRPATPHPWMDTTTNEVQDCLPNVRKDATSISEVLPNTTALPASTPSNGFAINKKRSTTDTVDPRKMKRAKATENDYQANEYISQPSNLVADVPAILDDNLPAEDTVQDNVAVNLRVDNKQTRRSNRTKIANKEASSSGGNKPVEEDGVVSHVNSNVLQAVVR